MNLPAEPFQFSQEEQGRLLARVYAFILSDEFKGMHKEQEYQQTTRPVETCQPRFIGTAQVLDAQELFSQEEGE